MDTQSIVCAIFMRRGTELVPTATFSAFSGSGNAGLRKSLLGFLENTLVQQRQMRKMTSTPCLTEVVPSHTTYNEQVWPALDDCLLTLYLTKSYSACP